jgi:hypothetical protein
MEAETKAQTLRARRLEQVRLVINKANDPGATEEERDSFLASADRLMSKYLIEEWETAMARPANEREKPVVQDWDLPEGSFDYVNTVAVIFSTLTTFARCKLVTYGRKMKVVGFESDLQYLDMLFTSVMLHLANSIEPHVDGSKSWVENLANLKNAGRKWETIHAMLNRAGLQDYPYLGKPWVKGGKGFGLMVSEYKRWASAHNMPVVGISPDVWRRSFIAGYRDSLNRRVFGLTVERQGEGIELHGRDEAIMEIFFDLRPEMRPHPEDCECDQCHFLKCHDLNCKRPRCVQGRKPVRYKAYNAPALSALGIQAGRDKGNEVSLSRGDIGNKEGGGRMSEETVIGINIEFDIDLEIKDVWPDGDAPEVITPAAVIAVIKAGGFRSVSHWMQEWDLDVGGYGQVWVNNDTEEIDERTFR